MAKDRLLTPEERKLWREVTKHDVKLKLEPPERAPAGAEEAPSPLPAVSSPQINSPTPPARARALPPHEVLSGRQATRLLKLSGAIEGRLDLHGMGKIEAYGAIQNFIRSAQVAGRRHLLIITGKGRGGDGILRAHLPDWLNEQPLRRLIAGLAYSPAREGGSGALHVLLRRAKHS